MMTWPQHISKRRIPYEWRIYRDEQKSILPTDTKQLQNERLQTKPNMKQTQMRFVQFD